MRGLASPSTSGPSVAAAAATARAAPTSIAVEQSSSAVSVRIFGLSTWSVMLPQAACGVASLVIVVHLVKRWMGPAVAYCSTVVCGSLWRNDVTPQTLEAVASGGRRVFLGL